MANNVTVSVLGGTTKVFESGVSTPADAIRLMSLSGNYTATANGESVALTESLEDFTFLALALSVKGGATKAVKKPVKKPAKKVTKQVKKPRK